MTNMKLIWMKSHKMDSRWGLNEEEPSPSSAACSISVQNWTLWLWLLMWCDDEIVFLFSCSRVLILLLCCVPRLYIWLYVQRWDFILSFVLRVESWDFILWLCYVCWNWDFVFWLCFVCKDGGYVRMRIECFSLDNVVFFIHSF